jgi:Flp pilus assembly protein TadG
MIGPLHSILRDRTGVSAIEFGILAPVLFAIVFGAIEYGRMFYVRQGMENAVEQGARYYMLNPSATQAAVTSQISAAMVGGMGGSCRCPIQIPPTAIPSRR